MKFFEETPGKAIVMGASGQDGYFLTRRLLEDGWLVHATCRQASLFDFDELPVALRGRLRVHQIDLLQPEPVLELIKQVQPEEFYNLAGQSRVSESFSDPLYTWQTNAEAVVHLLECVRKNSAHTRFYQASSTDMFGVPPGGTTVFTEDSALNPQSPYASAKAAAHLLCHSYRQVYGLSIASGMLSNHESHRRPAWFLSRKVVDHVVKLKERSNQRLATAPIAVGNLKVQRDWGFAPEYVEGMFAVIRQIKVRAAVGGPAVAAPDNQDYRDYILATGNTHAVWELIDCAFRIAGFDLDWHLEGDDPSAWCACFRETKKLAVTVSAEFLRTAEPRIIRVDPSRARKELGWSPSQGLEVFLRDIFTGATRQGSAGTAAG